MGLLDRLFQSNRVNIEERFEVLREAVSGTMSKFYVVRDRKYDRVVGLKIGDRQKTETFENRFKGLKKPLEGEIAMGFKHPLIVETYEYGKTTDGLNYIVMEYVKGPGLQTLIYNRDPLLEGKRVNLIKEMAEAVSVVHKAGYIHRDVCPRNFICSPDAESLKLIDFGLTLPARKEFMQPGNRTGTPLYMAPEVIRRRWTDHRVDIFSLGVTCFHLCTFELPWPVSETSGLAALAHDTHAARDILRCRPRLNRILARAIASCIDPDPNRRPATVDDFLRMIRPVKEEEED